MHFRKKHTPTTPTGAYKPTGSSTNDNSKILTNEQICIKHGTNMHKTC